MGLMNPRVWILTEEYNDYDQHGEYFLGVYTSKPTIEQLLGKGVPQNCLRHVLNGGGRKGTEDQWFHLRETEPIAVVPTEETP